MTERGSRMNDTYEAKGTAILSIIDFVKTKFGPGGLERWRAALSPATRALVDPQRLSASAWYPGAHAMEMRQAIVDLFYDHDRAKIRALGYFSGERGLTGIYKLAVKFGSPMWVVDRLGMVFSTYFRPGLVVVSKREAGDVSGRLEGFPDHSGIMEEVFAGFVQKALELSGVSELRVTVARAAPGAPVEVQARWK